VGQGHRATFSGSAPWCPVSGRVQGGDRVAVLAMQGLRALGPGPPGRSRSHPHQPLRKARAHLLRALLEHIGHGAQGSRHTGTGAMGPEKAHGTTKTSVYPGPEKPRGR
jgi:hypothetical protein